MAKKLDINTLFKDVLQEISKLATFLFKENTYDAVKDGMHFVEYIQPKLEESAHQLATGELGKDEFVDLVAGEKDLIKLAAYKRMGIAAVSLDKFREGVLNTITASVFSIIGI